MTLGQSSYSTLMINDMLNRYDGEEDELPEIDNMFTSSRDQSIVGDWGGISAHWYDHPSPVCDSICFPAVNLKHCDIEYGFNGVSCENSKSLAVLNSYVHDNEEIGISVKIDGTMLPDNTPGEIYFTIAIDSCDIINNPEFGVSIYGSNGEADCDYWKNLDIDANPDSMWDSLFYSSSSCLNANTLADVTNNSITNSKTGIICLGNFGLYIVNNTVEYVERYGIQLHQGVAGTVGLNSISTSGNHIKHAGIYLNNAAFVFTYKNTINYCKEAGISIINRSGAICAENYIHDIGFTNILIQDCSPHIRPSENAGNPSIMANPNTLIDSDFGIYIVNTDPGGSIYPSILNNRIKHHSKSGIYITSEASPFLGGQRGANYYYGLNSIDNTSMNLIADFQSNEHIDAENNWWGSRDPHEFTFKIDVNHGTIDYYPWLDFDPYPGFSPKIAQTTDSNLPKEFSITSAYPNPFNPNVVFSFYLPEEGYIGGEIFDILGRRVKTLVNQVHTPGQHSVLWNGKNDKGDPVGSGVYFFRLRNGDQQAIKKVSLLK